MRVQIMTNRLMRASVANLISGMLLALSANLAWADILYVHTDHLNTPRLATNEQGVTVWRNLPTTEPFGNSPVEEDPDGDSISTTLNPRFPGQYYDRETNLNYNWNRTYDPGIGAYHETEPLGLAGDINLYRYARNNPLSYIDPDGNQATLAISGGGATAGGGASAAGGASALGPGLAVVGAGLAGYGIGTLIYPYIEAPVSKAVDWCMSSSSKQECLDNCYAAYLNQVRICKMAPTPKARAQCYAGASDLHGQCRAGCK